MITRSCRSLRCAVTTLDVLLQARWRTAETAATITKIVEGGLRKIHGRLILMHLLLGRSVRENHSLAFHVNQEVHVKRL